MELVLAHENEVRILKESLQRRDEEIRRLENELAQGRFASFSSFKSMREANDSGDISNIIIKCAQILATELASRDREIESNDRALLSERELSESLEAELRGLKDRLSEAQKENAALASDLASFSECSLVLKESASRASEEAEMLKEKLNISQDQLKRAREALKECRIQLELSNVRNSPSEPRAPTTCDTVTRDLTVTPQNTSKSLIEALQLELHLVRGDLRTLISLGLDQNESIKEEQDLGHDSSMLSVLRLLDSFHSEDGRFGEMRMLSAQIEHVLLSALLKKSTGSAAASFVSPLVQEMNNIFKMSRHGLEIVGTGITREEETGQSKLELNDLDHFSTPIRHPFAVYLDNLEGGWAGSGALDLESNDEASSSSLGIFGQRGTGDLDSWDLPPMTPPPTFD